MRARGFTLIEVIVALFVVALGMGALLATLTSSADTISHLRNKSFAQWIALNRLSEVRLAAGRPGTGRSEGEIQYAGSTWRWRQDISNPGVAGVLRIDVAVGLGTGTERPAEGETQQDFAVLGRAYGFFGTAVNAPSGFDPDWSLSAPGRGPEGDDEDGPDGGPIRDPRLDAAETPPLEP